MVSTDSGSIEDIETKRRYEHIVDNETRRKSNIPMHKDLKNLIRLNIVYNFFIGFASPFMVIFFNNYGSLEEVGIAIALMYVLQGTMSYLTSNLFSKFSARMIVLISQIAEGLRILGFLFVQDVYGVYVLQALGGIISGFNSPAYSNVYVDVCSDESGKNIGKQDSFPTIAYGISSLLSGFIIGSFGYAPVFIIWSIQEFVYGLFIYYKVR
jgi:MFS family permease